MKKVKRHTVYCFLFIIFLLEIPPCRIVDAEVAVAKNNSSEWYIENGHSNASVRWKRKYGLLAKNVKSVKIGKNISLGSGSVFISQREGEWRNIDFSKKYIRPDRNGILYKNDLVARGASDFYPIDVTDIFLKKGGKELLFTGLGTVGLPLIAGDRIRWFCETHVFKNTGGCWEDDGMLACIRDGALRIHATWGDVETLYKKKFFKGKTDRIRKVVLCIDSMTHKSTFFVLMKDGTVWGMGYNKYHAISNKDKEYYAKFVKLKVKNVKDICAADRNIGILKKDGSLWVWGQKRSGKNGRNKKFTATPWLIDKNVRSFSMAVSGRHRHNCILLFIKNGSAYGWGSARGYALPKKSKNNRHNDRPVFLKNNIKQVYAAPYVTLLLANDGNLYWRGSAANPVDLSWIEKKLKRKKR